MHQKQKFNNKNPQEGISLFSKLTFAWTFQFYRTGFRRDLVEKDLFPPLKSHSSSYLGERLQKFWKGEEKLQKNKKNYKPSLWKVLLKSFGVEMLIIGFFQFFSEICIRLPQPILLAKILSYYNGNKNNMSTEEAYYWSTGLILCFLLSGPFFQLGMFYMLTLGMKFRVACCALIYRKLLRTSKSPKMETSSGQIVNFLSNDMLTLDLALICSNYLWIGPIKTIIVVYLMYLEVDLSAVLGVIVLLLLVPLQTSITKLVSKLTMKAASKTDERLRILNEVILGIQVIKMYAWEKPFSYLVNKAREEEIKALRKYAFIDIVVMSIQWYVARVGIFITIVAYVLLGNKITVEKAFMISAFYNDLKNCMNIMFTYSMQRIAQSSASIERIRIYLLSEELEKKLPEIPNNYLKKGKDISGPVLTLKNVSAKWPCDTKDVSKNTLDGINFSINAGSLTAVIGPVGAGKSSLLHLILGELPIQNGTLNVHGKLIYVSQEPWIFAASVRQNILFGQPMDKSRYDKVIKVCQLERDFSLFSHKDQTIIGEKGTTLSGGQRARINLARAVYAEADIYLFDDPLSAVDTHVGRSIFKDCICDYLQGKTRVLVTHQLQYLQNVDQTYVLHDGFVQMSGTFEELKRSNLTFLSFLQSENEVEADKEINGNSEKEEFKASDIVSEEEVEGVAEQTVTGKMSKKVFLHYFRATGNIWVRLLMIGLVFLMPILLIVGDYFMTYWVTWLEANDENIVTNQKDAKSDYFWFVYVYTGLILATIVVVYMKHLIFMMMCMNASKNLHATMFQSVSRATMSFFHNNPSGRIINRFSKDMGILDKILPQAMNDVTSFFMFILAMSILTIIVNYWMLIPLVVAFFVLSVLKEIYLRTSRSVKRLDGLTKSPFFNHLNASIQGLSTIRAFKAESLMINEFDNHQDLNNSAWFLSISCAPSFCYYVETICAIYLGIIIYIFLLLDDMSSAGDVALIITQTISMTIILFWGLYQQVEVENNMTSVERILDYNKIPEEPPLESEPEKKPSKQWPAEGRIEFKNLSLKYSPESSPVLKNLNFIIEPKEKIGIVGRTGAGKSSMIVALFRLSKFEGEIVIDEIPISTLGLHDLRAKISIIPQEPLLFAGTLRANLDPFDEFSDDELWQSLAEVELKNYVKDMVSGLYGKVADGGTNFSVGQRQLLCLARAIVRKNKILVLDEATANVDPQTDSLIQKTIRSRFQDCTVFIVAHRLNTVMDCDRFIVMDAGQIVEFDHPHLLLQNKNGYLQEMVRQSGTEMSATLRTMAETSYQTRRELSNSGKC